MKKTKRRRLTIENKADIVTRLAAGEKASNLATEYRVSNSAISYIKKNAGDLARPAEPEPAAPAPHPVSLSGHFDTTNAGFVSALLELAAAVRSQTEEMKLARRTGK